MEMQRGAIHFTLTVFRDLQDVADQGAVAVKRLGPCEVDGSLLCGAQNRDWILWSMGKLPVGTDMCEEEDQATREAGPGRKTCVAHHVNTGEKRKGSRPDSEVGAAGVIAPHRGHPAGVCSDVSRPRLGDVQGPVGIQPQARGHFYVNHRAALLPHVAVGDLEA